MRRGEGNHKDSLLEMSIYGLEVVVLARLTLNVRGSLFDFQLKPMVIRYLFLLPQASIVS